MRKLKVPVKGLVVQSSMPRRAATHDVSTPGRTPGHGVPAALISSPATMPFAGGRPGCVDVSAPTRPRASIRFMPQ